MARPETDRNKLISRAYSQRPCGFRFEIVNSPDVDRPPAGEPSNFHRIRETTTVNARNARSRRGNEACHSSQKPGIGRNSIRLVNFSAISCHRGPPPRTFAFFNNACVPIYILYRFVHLRPDLSTGILTFSPNPEARLGKLKWFVGVGDKIGWIAGEGKRLRGCARVIWNRIRRGFLLGTIRFNISFFFWVKKTYKLLNIIE